MHNRWLLCCLLLTGIACWGCGPKTLPPEFTTPTKNNAFSSANILAKFNAPLDEAYRLGEGDKITIDVWDHPELSGEHIVGPDGRITLPYAGVMPFAGLSREGAAKAVEETLSHFYGGVPPFTRLVVQSCEGLAR
jgi:polysaccharide export outer membrane protein